MAEVNVYREPAAVLGEGPLWDPKAGRIWWVDCDQKKLFSRDPATGLNGPFDTHKLPHAPGSYAFRENGKGLIIAYRNKLALVDLATGEHQPFEAPGVNFAVERFNDGLADRAGRFWTGTMALNRTDRTCKLYRIDPDLSVHLMATDIVVSNGMAISPDDKILYHTDSRSGIIYAYDFDIDKGTIANRRVFANFEGRPGHPDGCTIDAEGHLWIAEIGSGRVVHFDEKGRQIGAIELPTKRPTSTMLGGADLKTLFITTMQHGLTPEELAAQPLAGCLFAARVDVPGMPEPRFAG